MKFALFTGCVAKGATRELMVSTMKTADALGIEFVEMKSAACCGAGVVSEQSPDVRARCPPAELPRTAIFAVSPRNFPRAFSRIQTKASSRSATISGSFVSGARR